MKYRLIIAALAASITLAACGSNIPTGSISSADSVRSQGVAPVVYVLNTADYQATISVFSGPTTSFVRSVQLGKLSDQGGTIATDSEGHFYASPSSYGKQVLNVYTSKAARVAYALEQEKLFSYVTLDSRNHIYTACSTTRICEYAAVGKNDRTQLVRSIGLKALGAVVGPMAVDGRGNLALSNSNFILVFAPSSPKPSVDIPSPGLYATSVAFDSAGNLYAATSKGIHVYSPGSTSPTRTITEGFAYPTDLAFDARGNLFVLNACGTRCSSTPDSICVFAPGESQPNRTITKGLDNSLEGMAVSSSGGVYASNKDGSVAVYPPEATKPQKVIKKNLSSPTKLVVSS